MMFALGAGALFNITEKDEYVETIICTFLSATSNCKAGCD